MTKSEKINLAKSVLKEIKTKANAEARAFGFSIATEIIKGEKLEVVEYVESGYRKYTTGEYVCNAYRNKFGWKNTYYESAKCVVSLSPVLWAKKEKWEKYLKSVN